MTELDAVTLGAIADSADSAAKLALLGDHDGARSALARAEHRLGEFTEGKPWHARSVRLAREAVGRASALVSAGSADLARQRRAVARAVARAKTR